ncbi:uncharacterized protein METZ01_LOCUS31785 [marine metagenome]|uniref:Uncharacterized protein n=1 Tax=marine metagenome TaxID=408172 RepID=A0A381QHY5_9ZZZZ
MLPLLAVAALLDNRTEDDKRQCGRSAVAMQPLIEPHNRVRSLMIVTQTFAVSLTGLPDDETASIPASCRAKGVFPPR